jgi:hypothetical protein
MRNIIRRIGPDWFVEVREDTEVTRTYEFAAWYQKILLTPGKYQFTWVPERYRGRWVVTIPGTITKSYFPSGFGGVLYPSKSQEERDARDVGKQTEWHISIYDYDIRETELEDEEEDYTGLRAVLTFLDSVRLGIHTRDWHTHRNKKHWTRQIKSLESAIKILEKERDNQEAEDWDRTMPGSG